MESRQQPQSSTPIVRLRVKRRTCIQSCLYTKKTGLQFVRKFPDVYSLIYVKFLCCKCSSLVLHESRSENPKRDVLLTSMADIMAAISMAAICRPHVSHGGRILTSKSAICPPYRCRSNISFGVFTLGKKWRFVKLY